MIIPVVLSGGSGTRLWPLSRSDFPKQFLNLFKGHSLFQITLNRIKNLALLHNPIVVCNEAHRFIVYQQAQDINFQLSTILLEPTPRNTAPAIALVAIDLMRKGHSDANILILPSDHIIKDEKAFSKACQKAEKLANKGFLVTFGIKTTRAETGFGYIKASKKLSIDGFKVDHFTEKPDLLHAKKYLENTAYFWNSGMFMFKVSQVINELNNQCPAIINACKESIELGRPDLGFFRVDEDAFKLNPSESIDYALMEKTLNAAMVPLNAGWNDVGSWPAVWELQDKDRKGNAGSGNFISIDSNNNFIHNDKRLIALLGVKDLIVIETSDALMVAHKNLAQNVKELVYKLKKDGCNQTEIHKKVFRPWGWFEEIDRGNHFQVKRIVVKPKEKLSLQLHRKRSEHWVVVVGKAKIQIGAEIKILSENESVYIPKKVKHSLENVGKINLEIIEIQTGVYLGEDDIERFEDRYGRASKNSSPRRPKLY